MFNLQIEIFVLIAVGYMLSKLGMISLQTRKQLTSMILSLFLPASIICSFELELTPAILQACLGVFAASVLIQILYWVFMKVCWRKVSDENRRINLQYGTMVSNAGFMGMPVAEAAFGAQGLLYSSIFLIPQRICMWSTGLGLYTDGITWKEKLMKVLTHPCIVALGIGVILLFAEMQGFVMPQWLEMSLKACASCSTALSMIVIGAILADVPFREMADPVCLIYSLVRLIVLPGIVWAAGMLLNLSSLGLSVCVLECAMPAPSTMVMLAQKYDRDTRFASRLVFVSTALSLVVLPFWLFLLS